MQAPMMLATLRVYSGHRVSIRLLEEATRPRRAATWTTHSIEDGKTDGHLFASIPVRHSEDGRGDVASLRMNHSSAPNSDGRRPRSTTTNLQQTKGHASEVEPCFVVHECLAQRDAAVRQRWSAVCVGREQRVYADSSHRPARHCGCERVSVHDVAKVSGTARLTDDGKPPLGSNTFDNHLRRQLGEQEGAVEDGLAVVVVVCGEAEVGKEPVGERV